MGGLLLLAAMVAAYIIIYWSITIETYGDKKAGLLGFKEGSDGSTHDLKQVKNCYLPKKETAESPQIDQNIKTSYKKSDSQNQKIPYKSKHKSRSYLKSPQTQPSGQKKNAPYLKQDT